LISSFESLYQREGSIISAYYENAPLKASDLSLGQVGTQCEFGSDILIDEEDVLLGSKGIVGSIRIDSRSNVEVLLLNVHVAGKRTRESVEGELDSSAVVVRIINKESIVLGLQDSFIRGKEGTNDQHLR
jgi:hypothetical protein